MVITKRAIRSLGLGIRYYKLVIRSLEFNYSFSWEAIRSVDSRLHG